MIKHGRPNYNIKVLKVRDSPYVDLEVIVHSSGEIVETIVAENVRHSLSCYRGNMLFQRSLLRVAVDMKRERQGKKARTRLNSDLNIKQSSHYQKCLFCCKFD